MNPNSVVSSLLKKFKQLWCGVALAPLALSLLMAGCLGLQPAAPKTTPSLTPAMANLTPSLTSSPSATTTLVPPTATATLTLTPTIVPTVSALATAVSDKDGMKQVYVPEGEFWMGSSAPDAFPDQQPQHKVFLDAFWIDQTDVTNAMYALCVKAGKCQDQLFTESATRDSYYGETTFDPYPVVNISLNDANAYCAWAGRRLPSEAEWEKAARGTDARLYPWGNQPPDASRLNFAGLVKDTTAVGQYPAGASPYGALDMAGNVRQWVADRYDGHYYASSPARNPTGPKSGQLYESNSTTYILSNALRGSDYDEGVTGSVTHLLSADRHAGQPVAGYNFVGFRCARAVLAGERAALPSSPAASLSATPPTAPAVSPLAQAPKVSTIATSVSEKDGMLRVYVPAGAFLMGSDVTDLGAELDEMPQHLVTLDAYWIDQTPVSNAMYALCVKAEACPTPTMPFTYAYFGVEAYANYPAMSPLWTAAEAYCQWAGGRLPSEAEWEKAARGTDARLYPWGNQPPDLTRIYYNNLDTRPYAVGQYPAGASPYGALDMLGDVPQRVADWYDRAYYAGSPDHNPTGPTTGIDRVIRGTSWVIGSSNKNTSGFRLTTRFATAWTSDLLNISSGETYQSPEAFRCVRPASAAESAAIQAPTPTPPAPTATPTLEPTATPTLPGTPAPTLNPVATRVSDKDGMVQVEVPAGDFTMGAADSDPDAERNEKPQHKVTLDAFWIDQTDVTNAMYALCVKAEGCPPPADIRSATRGLYYGNSAYANYPRVNVSWSDAQTFCQWAGGRLPSEAEWEMAARGTDGRPYPWGNQPPDLTRLSFNDQWRFPYRDTTAVGLFPAGASPYGALDMLGNVQQWVGDVYLALGYGPNSSVVNANQNYYYDHSPSVNPTGPEPANYQLANNMRGVRGSMWSSLLMDTRVTARTGYFSFEEKIFLNTALKFSLPLHNTVGFRCASAP